MKELLFSLTVNQLRAIARKLKLRGYSVNTRKEELVKFILDNEKSDKNIRKAIRYLSIQFQEFKEVNDKLQKLVEQNNNVLKRNLREYRNQIIVGIVGILISILLFTFDNTFLKSDHKNLPALFEKGKILFDNSQYSEAIEFFEIIDNHQPNFPNNYYYLALCNNNLQNYNEAAFYFEKVPVKEDHEDLLFCKGLNYSNFNKAKARRILKEAKSEYSVYEKLYWHSEIYNLISIENIDTFFNEVNKSLQQLDIAIITNPYKQSLDKTKTIRLPGPIPKGTILGRVDLRQETFDPFLRSIGLKIHLLMGVRIMNEKNTVIYAINTFLGSQKYVEKSMFALDNRELHVNMWLLFDLFSKLCKNKYEIKKSTLLSVRNSITNYYETISINSDSVLYLKSYADTLNYMLINGTKDSIIFNDLNNKLYKTHKVKLISKTTNLYNYVYDESIFFKPIYISSYD